MKLRIDNENTEIIAINKTLEREISIVKESMEKIIEGLKKEAESKIAPIRESALTADLENRISRIMPFFNRITSTAQCLCRVDPADLKTLQELIAYEGFEEEDSLWGCYTSTCFEEYLRRMHRNRR